MEPVQKALSHQTAVSVTQLEMQLMPFIRLHLENANVSVWLKSVTAKDLYTVIVILNYCSFLP